jgi:hypothetical protein
MAALKLNRDICALTPSGLDLEGPIARFGGKFEQWYTQTDLARGAGGDIRVSPMSHQLLAHPPPIILYAHLSMLNSVFFSDGNPDIICASRNAVFRDIK